MSGTSATTRDTEIARNPHQPEGWRRDGIDFFVASSSAMYAHDIASSLLRELDAVALATNVMVFLGRDTNGAADLWPRLRRCANNLLSTTGR